MPSQMYKEVIIDNKISPSFTQPGLVGVPSYPHAINSLSTPVPLPGAHSRGSNPPSKGAVKVVQVTGEPTLTYTTPDMNAEPTSCRAPEVKSSSSVGFLAETASPNAPNVNKQQTENKQDTGLKKGGWQTSKPHRFTCKLCDAHYTFRTNLTRHVRKKHGQAELDSLESSSS